MNIVTVADKHHECLYDPAVVPSRRSLAMTRVRRRSKARIGLGTAIALIAGTLGVLTIFCRDWIEALTGWDPDYYNGSLEWLIVAALLAVSAVFGAAARRDWHLRSASSETPA
jgi:H+/Cl- antiporter ClcA